MAEIKVGDWVRVKAGPLMQVLELCKGGFIRCDLFPSYTFVEYARNLEHITSVLPAPVQDVAASPPIDEMVGAAIEARLSGDPLTQYEAWRFCIEAALARAKELGWPPEATTSPVPQKGIDHV